VRIGSRILQVFWQPPEPKKQNGEIVGYRLCIKEKRFSHLCRANIITNSSSSSQMNMYSFDGLKPFTVYNILVEAKTFVGYGPGQYLDYRTGEAGREKNSFSQLGANKLCLTGPSIGRQVCLKF
jgi:hypothetical protein